MSTVPAAPSVISATVGDGQSIVSFTTPDNGGSVILDYTVTATDTIVTANGGQTATGNASPLTVTGLINGDAYTFTVTARNANGSSNSSPPSGLVIPAATSLPPSTDPPIPNSVAYPITKKVNLPQLIDELVAATSQTVNVSEVGDPTAVNGPDAGDLGSTLWIAPASLNSATVETVIANHDPDPTYDVPETTKAYADLLAKIQNNPEAVLSDAEIATGVKGVMLRLNLTLFNS